MTINLHDPAFWTYGLALVASIVFGVHLALGARGARRGQFLLAAVMLTVPWSLSAVAALATGEYVWWVALRLIDGFRIAAWIAFLYVLLARADSRPESPPPPRAAWVSGLVLCATSIAAALLPMASPIPNIATPAPGRLSIALLLGVTIFALVLVESLVRNSTEDSRWRLKPLLLGVGAAFVFDLFMYADALLFGQIEGRLWTARPLVQVLVIPFVALATVRNRDWTIDIAISRGVVFHSTALLAAGLYLLVMSAAGYYVQFFGGEWGKLLQVAFLFGAMLLFVTLMVSGSARARLRVWINKNFFSFRYDYRAEWLRVTNLLSSRGEAGKLNERVIRALADLVESSGGVLWTRRDGSVYRPTGRWMAPEFDAEVSASSKLIDFLGARGWVVDLRELAANPELYEGLAKPEWVASFPRAWLLIPLTAVDDLVGFVALSEPRTPIDVNWEVRDLLKSAGRQAASYLAQVQASEALLEAGKFDAFNKMSAFVVHDLKNLASQLTLLLRNAERHGDNPEFRQDMLLTVRHVAERMTALLAQLRAGTVPVANPAPVELGAVLRRVAEGRGARTPAVVIDAPARIYALGHDDRLERVISHLVQNAQDATRDGSAVEVTVSEAGGYARVEVVDRGVGMSPEFIRDRLFKPFQRLHSMGEFEGNGIGLSTVQRIVSRHGGWISGEGRPGEGATFRFTLWPGPRA